MGAESPCRLGSRPVEEADSRAPCRSVRTRVLPVGTWGEIVNDQRYTGGRFLDEAQESRRCEYTLLRGLIREGRYS